MNRSKKWVITMTLVDTFSVAIGSVVVLALLGSIAVEEIRRLTHKNKIIPTINNKRQKIEVQI
jgi:hypothetical protein